MYRRRRRGRKAAWQWSNNFSMTQIFGAEPTASPTWIATPNLLPAGRVQWLLEQQQRDKCQLAGILLWLDLIIYNNSTTPTTTAETFPVDFYVIKSKQDEANTVATQYRPYEQPTVPSQVLDWNETDEEDGLDPYLWTHHLSAIVPTYTNIHDIGGPAGGNSTAGVLLPINSANGGVIQPLNNVRAAWQPDVHIKSRRRLERGDCIVLGMYWKDFPISNLTYDLSVNCRVLLK